MNLTSRTDIWETVQGFVDNPVVGAGFDTFWAGERLRLLQSKTFGIIQAHNGYVETYLNGGWAGVLLLAIVLVSGYCRIRKRMAAGNLTAIVRYSLLVVAMIHNFSEASFNKNGPMWFVILFAIMDYRAVSPSHRPGIREWEERGGSRNSDSVISGSLALRKPPSGGESKERGDETNETESRSHLQGTGSLGGHQRR
jgi:O-antigen ligase